MHTRWFPSGCIASPHHLASAAGQSVLADGGNAVDAAVAANLVLGVVTPYHCGFGGDLLAIVWDGRAHGVLSVGRAPAGATPQAIRAAIDAGHGDPDVAFDGTDGMPMFGALPVTVPGAVAGWFRLLDRWGSRSFGAAAAAARRLAVKGFVPSPHGASYAARAAPRLSTQPGWSATYGHWRAGQRVQQPGLGRLLTLLAEEGPDAYYRGPVADAIVEVLQAHGSAMARTDLAQHQVEEVAPLRGRFRDLEVLELPPPTQGMTALTALGIIDALGPSPDDPAVRLHRQVEAVRLALADRQQYLGDPDVMTVDARDLLATPRLQQLARSIDDANAATHPPVRPAPGGTAYLCAADRTGLLVSLIQSNFVGYGSGVVVPEYGFGLHDRGAHFSLDPARPSAIAPGRRPPHTLIPALALRSGRPHLVFGTMGGDGQAQIHLQVLTHLLDEGCDPAAAVDAPRWVVDPADGTVSAESRFPAALLDGLKRRGHTVDQVGAYEHQMGHAHLIRVEEDGYAAASDPRCEGSVCGL